MSKNTTVFNINRFNKIKEEQQVHILSYLTLREWIYFINLHIGRFNRRLALCDSAQDDALWSQVWKRNIVAENGALHKLYLKYGSKDAGDIEAGFYLNFVNLIRTMNKHSQAIVVTRLKHIRENENRNDDFYSEHKGHIFVGAENLRKVIVDPEKKLKTVNIVLIGDTDTGKSSFASVARQQKTEQIFNVEPPISRDVLVNEGVTRVPIEIIDTDCANKSDTTARVPVLREADVVIVLFSITDTHSFIKSVETDWVRECMKYCPDAKWILVGTKADLYSRKTMAEYLLHDDFPITKQEGLALAEKFGFIAYCHSSTSFPATIEEVLKLCVLTVHGQYDPTKFLSNEKGKRGKKNKKCIVA